MGLNINIARAEPIVSGGGGRLLEIFARKSQFCQKPWQVQLASMCGRSATMQRWQLQEFGVPAQNFTSVSPAYIVQRLGLRFW